MLASVSLNDAPVSATPSLLPSVKVMVLVAPYAMLAGPKALAMVAGVAVTVSVATLEAAPVGACALATALAWLPCGPGTSLVTTNVTVQLPGVAPAAAGMVRPEIETAVWPLVRLLLPAPAHVPPAACAPEIDIAPRASVNEAAVNAVALALEIVRVTVLVPSAAMVVGENALAMVGATAFTVRFALATALLPFEVCSAPAAMVLVNVPPIGETTSTETVQLPGVAPAAAGIERVAGSVTRPEPVAATTAPEPGHVVDAFGVGATTTGTGNVSVNAAVRLAVLALPLVSVMVSVETALAFTVPGAKAFATAGTTAFTVRFALAGLALLPFAVCSAPAAIVLV